MNVKIKRGLEIKLSEGEIKLLNEGERLRKQISDVEIINIRKAQTNALEVIEGVGYIINIFFKDFGIIENDRYIIEIRGENDESRSGIKKEFWDKIKR